MQALQYTCWHSLKQRQPEPSFSTKQIPHPKILLSNAFCLCTSSKSRSWGRGSARGSNRGTARGSNRDDEDSWGSCFSFVTSFFFLEGSQRLSHWGSAKKAITLKKFSYKALNWTEKNLLALSAHYENERLCRTFSQLTCRSGFLFSLPALLPLMLMSRGDTMPRKYKVSSLRNWIHVKSISQPWFSSHSSSSRLHRQLI